MSGESFVLSVHEVDSGVTRVTLGGEVDETVSHRFVELWEQVLTPGKVVELDMRQVTFLNSTGVAALVQGHHLAQAANSTLTIINPSPIVQRVLEICGIDHHLQTLSD